VLDCCAAPGNKTTHVAALVGREGSVIACEKDPRRFETLQGTLARCKASNVQPMLGVRTSPTNLTLNCSCHGSQCAPFNSLHHPIVKTGIAGGAWL
jgi:16S rRNA methyltransferase RsmB/F